MQSGIESFQNGQHDVAEHIFDTVLNAFPDRPDAHSMKGVVLLAKNLPVDAANFFKRATQLNPDVADFWFNLALARYMSGELDQAMEAARIAVTVNPRYSEAWNQIGMILNDQKDWQNAKNAFEKGVEYTPDYGFGWVNLCGVLRELKELDDALEAGLKSVRLLPDLPQAHFNLAHCYDARQEYEKSVESISRCLELDPGYADAYSNLARTLNSLSRHTEAIEAATKAVDLAPTNDTAIVNLALGYSNLGDFETAISLYKTAIQHVPNSIEAHNNLAHAALSVEDFSYGWEEYEWCILAEHRAIFESDTPLWEGEPVSGKRLHLMGEQGIGEQIMFSTMIPELLSRGAHVTFECEKRLAPIYARPCSEFESVGIVNPADPKILHGNFDFKVLVGSLGRWYRTRVEDFVPQKGFLQAHPDLLAACRNRYTSDQHDLVVGISWKSGSKRFGDKKNIPLEYWKPIFEALPHARFVSLQYGDVEDDIEEVKRLYDIDILVDSNISAVDSLEESAAQVAAVDFVISISNATVHLAGALGVPTMMMVGPVTLWHWFRNRKESLWYESVAIYRRQKQDDWNNVVNELVQDIPLVLEKRLSQTQNTD